MNLDLHDYKSILDYYKINYKNLTNNSIVARAEKILSAKLCRCIKKPSTTKEDCTIKRKGLKLNKFKCKKQNKLISFGKTRKKIKKHGHTLTIKKLKR